MGTGVTVSVQRVCEALEPLFMSTLPTWSRLDHARPFLDGSDPTMRGFHSAIRQSSPSIRAVRDTARLDGSTIIASQQFFGLFNPSRNRTLTQWQFDTLRNENARGIVEQALRAALDVLSLRGRAHPMATVTAWIFPADPANAYTMLSCHGLEAWGDTPGAVAVQLWPSRANIARLPLVTIRALALGYRSAITGPNSSPTVAEHLVREGLASTLVCELHAGPGAPWAIPFTRPSDWRDTLRSIAHASGFESYANLPVNVYGVTAPAGADHLPDPPMVNVEHMALIHARCLQARGTVDPVEIAGLLYGDEPLAMNGHPVLGLPFASGFAVAHSVVSAGIRRLGCTIAEAFHLPTYELVGT